MSTISALSGMSLPIDPTGVMDAATVRQIVGGVFALPAAGSNAVSYSPHPQKPIGVDANYAAFPGATVLPNGNLRLVWRHGTDHVTSRNGTIRSSVSADLGRTWATATTIVTDAAAPDLRDPSISTLIDKTKVWLSYFKASASNAAAGVFVRSSVDNGVTWSAEIRVDALTYSAVTSPIVDMGGGTLLLAYYGRATGDTWDSCWLAKSTNGGTTWTNTRIANGQTAANHYQEPWLVRRGTTVVMMHRYGTAANIGYCRSTDSGVTWSAPVSAFAGGGRPSTVWLWSNALVVVYRRLADGYAVMRYSRDSGTTWYPEKLVAPNNAGFWMNYAAPIEVSFGIAYCALAIDSASTVSRHYSGYISDGPGISPLGDLFLTSRQSAILDSDSVLWADNFAYPDGALPAPYVTSGAPTISGGYLVSTTADNVPDYALAPNLSPDVDVDADFYYTVQTGFGIVFRWVDVNNFMMFTIEGGIGSTFSRIYKFDVGVASQIATQVAATMSADAFNRLRVMAQGNVIRTYLNNEQVFRFVMTAPDYTKYGAAKAVGVKVNMQTTALHKCRRLVVRDLGL